MDRLSAAFSSTLLQIRRPRNPLELINAQLFHLNLCCPPGRGPGDLQLDKCWDQLYNFDSICWAWLKLQTNPPDEFSQAEPCWNSALEIRAGVESQSSCSRIRLSWEYSLDSTAAPLISLFSTHSWPARRQNVCHARQNELCVDQCFSPFRVWFIDVRWCDTCDLWSKIGTVIHLIWRRWGRVNFLMQPCPSFGWFLHGCCRFHQVGRIPESRLLEAVIHQKSVLSGSQCYKPGIYNIYIYIHRSDTRIFCITMNRTIKQTYIQCIHSFNSCL